MDRFWKGLLLIAVISTLGACGGAGGMTASATSTDTGSSGGSTGNSLTGDDISPLAISSSSGTGNVSFEGLEGTEEYILAVYSYNENGDSNSLEIDGIDSSSASTSTKILSKALISRGEEEDLTEDFHQMLRDQEEEVPVTQQNGIVKMGAAKTVSTPDIGTVRNFEVYNSLTSAGGTVKTTSTLVWFNDTLECWRDNDAVDLLSDTDIITICDRANIYIPYEQKLFDATPSDVDGNGRVIVHFTPTVNQIGGTAGIVTGYYSASLLASHGEIMNLLVPDEKGKFGTVIKKSFYSSNFVQHSIYHEYQHVMNYNMHVLVHKGLSEKSAWNEAQSHFLEGIESMEGAAANSEIKIGPVKGIGPENASRIDRGMVQLPTTSFAHGANIAQRGLSFLFLRCMYENAENQTLEGTDPPASGAAFLSRLMNSGKVGLSNIVYAATGNEENVADTFIALMGKFAKAILTNSMEAIDLDARQDDNRGTVLTLESTIQDVSSFPLTVTLGASSIGYYRLTADQIEKGGGALHIQLSDPKHVGAFILQTGF